MVLPLRFVIEGGQEMSPPDASPRATILIRDRRTLWELMLDPEIAFSEGYADGRIELTGDLVRDLEVVYKSWPTGGAANSLIGFSGYAAMARLDKVSTLAPTIAASLETFKKRMMNSFKTNKNYKVASYNVAVTPPST